MEVQTQVIVEPRETFTAAEIQNQSQVAGFKDLLSSLRLSHINLVDEIKALYLSIQASVQARADLVSSLKSEAITMYPLLAARDIMTAINESPEGSPLVLLWENYKKDLDALLEEINGKVLQFDQLKAELDSVRAKEKSILSDYAAFAAASSTPVPSVEDIEASLNSVDAIPSVDEGSVIVDFPAIELLNPEARALVTLQAAALEAGGEIEANSIQAQALELTAPQAVPAHGIKTWHLVLAGAALLYILS